MGAALKVTEIWRYPVSSLGGERLEQAAVGVRGFAGERSFVLVDEETGAVARPVEERWQSVPRIKARLTASAGVEIAIPGEAWIAVPGGEADRLLTRYMGFDAAIRPDRKRNLLADYTGLFGAGRYEPSPIHLLTTASLARLEALHPVGAADPRRFRPNIVVDMPPVDGVFPETRWIGRKLAIGDLRLTIAEPCRRCGFTILAQDGIASDPAILRNIVRHNEHNLGVYCTVDAPATVTLADRVFLE